MVRGFPTGRPLRHLRLSTVAPPRRWVGLAFVVSTVVTLLISVASVIQFAYRSPSLHVAVEIAAALISLLAAQLMYGRFRRSLDRRDLILTASLALFAGANLLFSAVPAATRLGAGPFATWAPAGGSLLATSLLAAGAFARPRPVRRPVWAAHRVAAGCVLALLVVGVAAAAAGGILPRAIAPGLSPEAASRPLLVGDPSILVVQLAVMGLFAAAALGFVRQTERTHDALTLWFAVGATFAAFARLNYFLFPSLYSEFFYTGDVLRLGFFLSLMIGGAQEIRVAQRELEQAAVLDERRRLAREIHDGIAQDLAFIAQQAGALTDSHGDATPLRDIETAARRALDESRGVIAALVRPTDEPLDLALVRVADEAAGRWGATVEARTAAGLELAAPAREAVMRIVGEAVTNAARHGRARRICLELSEEPELLVRVVDDGVGFDPASLQHERGRHGLTGMRERAEQIGARLQVDSRVGQGTRIVVFLT